MPNEVIAVAVTIEGSLGLPELAHLIGIQSGEAALERARLDAYVRMAIPSLRRIPAEGATLSEMCEAISLREIGRARGTILAAVCLRHLRFGVRKDGAPDRVCVLELFPEFPCLTEFGRTAPKTLLVAALVHLYGTSDEPVQVIAAKAPESPSWESALRDLNARHLETSPEWLDHNAIRVLPNLNDLWAFTSYSQSLAASHMLVSSAKQTHESDSTAKRNNRTVQLHVNWPHSFNTYADLTDLAAGRIGGNVELAAREPISLPDQLETAKRAGDVT